MWPTWQQSAVTGVICLAIGLILTLTKRRGAPVFFELTILAGLYMIWRVAGDLPLDTMKGAVARAHRVNDLERALHMPRPSDVRLMEQAAEAGVGAPVAGWLPDEGVLCEPDSREPWFI